MSNSTTQLDLISSSQAQKEVTANQLFDAASPAMLYGRRALTSAGLTFGYYGGVVSISGTPTQVANGTLLLTASATNYVEADPETGAVSANTSGFTAGRLPLYEVVTGTSTVTSYTDLRVFGANAGGISAEDLAEAFADHAAATDPHEQYQKESEKGVANGYASLDADGKVPTAQLPAASTQPFIPVTFYPGVPPASALMLMFAAPAGISTLTFAAALAGSSGKALVAATAQTDFDIRKNATSSSSGTSVGTMRFAAGATVPTFIAASGFTLSGGNDWLTMWAPATPDATLANVSGSLYCTR